MPRVTDFVKTSLKTDLAPDNKHDNPGSARHIVSRVPNAPSVFSAKRRERRKLPVRLGSTRGTGAGALPPGPASLRDVTPAEVPSSSRRGGPGWLRVPGSARSPAPAPQPRAAASAPSRAGPVRGQLPGGAAPAAGGRPSAAPSPSYQSFRWRAGGGRGSRRGGRRREHRVSPRRARAASPAEGAAAPTFQHRAEFVQGHCLPAGRGDHRRSMAAVPPPRGRCGPRLRLDRPPPARGHARARSRRRARSHQQWGAAAPAGRLPRRGGEAGRGSRQAVLAQPGSCQPG